MALVLAIDHGTERVGLAYGDDVEGYIVTQPAVQRTSDTALIQAVADIVTAKGIARVVVGLPVRLAGGDSAQTALVREFVRRLQQTLSVPVETIDERFTTRLAHRLRGPGQTSSYDSAAAALLLKTAFERREL